MSWLPAFCTVYTAVPPAKVEAFPPEGKFSFSYNMWEAWVRNLEENEPGFLPQGSSQNAYGDKA